MASLTVDADYDATIVILPGPDYIIDTTDSVQVGTDAGPIALRAVLRFPMSGLPAGSTITSAKVLTTQEQHNNGDDRSHYYGPYNSNGLADPEADSGPTMGSRSNITATNYLTTTTHRTNGNKEVDITTGGAAHIAASSGGTYTVVIQQTDESTDAAKNFKIFGEDQTPTAPDHIPQLQLEYTVASTNNFMFWRWRS